VELTQAQLVQRNLHQQLAAAQADASQLQEAQEKVAALTEEVTSLKEQLQVMVRLGPWVTGACRQTGHNQQPSSPLCGAEQFCGCHCRAHGKPTA
jgi:hypothetical protein